MFVETYSGPTIPNDLPICIPLKSGGSRWNNNELRFCLRSLNNYWNHNNCEVHLLTTSPPEWVRKDSIKVHYCNSYSDCVKFAIRNFETYLWMNDDIIFLKSTEISDLLPSRSMGEMTPNSGYKGNNWQKKLSEVRDKLHLFGYSPIFNFSSHTPYVFNSKLMEYAMIKFGLDYKTPLETAYFNIARHWHPKIECKDKLTLNNAKKIPADISKYRFLNLFDKGITPEVKEWLVDLFPTKSTYER